MSYPPFQREEGRLFRADMVRAILDGRKTQTRREITPRNSLLDGQPVRGRVTIGKVPTFGKAATVSRRSIWNALDWSRAEVITACGLDDKPYTVLSLPDRDGNAHIVTPKLDLGDRMWVRETFKYTPHQTKPIHYRADYLFDRPQDRPWKPGIHMPRWASRLTLELTELTRPQRLQNLSRREALAEGVCIEGWNQDRTVHWTRDPLSSWRILITDIHGADTWKANAWRWVYTFNIWMPT